MKTVFLGRAISKSKKRFDRLAIKAFFSFYLYKFT